MRPINTRPVSLRRALVTSLVLGSTVMVSTNGAAQTGLGGEWDFVVMSESGELQVRLRVELAATPDGQLRGATDRPGRSEMTGSITGSKVELFWDTAYEGTPVDLRFTGTVTEDGMFGSVLIHFGEPPAVTQSTWTATRTGPG